MHQSQQELPLYVLESHKRCKMRGLDPNSIPVPSTMQPEKFQLLFNSYTKILTVFENFANRFIKMLEGLPLMLVVTDDEGTILNLKGDPSIKDAMNELGFQPGAMFTEEVSGTNTASLALRMNQPIQLIGAEHYHEFLHNTACYSVPFAFEDKKTKKGTISIMTFADYQSPLLLTMLTTIVGSIQNELLLKEKNKQLNILNQIVMESTKNGILQTDVDGHVTEMNHVAEKLTGWNKQTLIGNKIDSDHPLSEYLKETLQEKKDFSDVEIWFVHEETGEKKVCLFDGTPLFDHHGQLTGAFAQLKDITERFEAKQRINHMAFHDELTGLPNRRQFNTRLNEKINKVVESEGRISIFLLDLDRFKVINDTLGHEKGDWLLVEVSKRLREFLPNHVELFRMGGDEFTIILHDFSHMSEVTEIAEGIIQLFQQCFAIENYEFHMSTSIGISYYPNDDYEPHTLFRKADTAMYRAKEQGKNNYFIYNSKMEPSTLEKLTFEQELRQAIQNDELELHYQPQINLCTQNIIGVEALIRWNHPKRGLIFPGDIIPLAEEMGLAVNLSEWVLKRASSQLKEWHERGYPLLKVAVNLSPQDFLRNSLVERVKQILLETDLEPKYLELEITESMTMDVTHATAIMKELNKLGVQIAIDDFGTGYSSFNYLKNFPIQHLKIDRSFVHDILNGQVDIKIISAIISLAHGLNLEVIAEGVETKEQADFLSNLHCNQAQGYYYSKPLPPHEIEEMIILFNNYSNSR